MKPLIAASTEKAKFVQDADPRTLYVKSAEEHGDMQIKADAARIKNLTSALKKNLAHLHQVPDSLRLEMSNLVEKLEGYTSDLMNIVDWASEVHVKAQRDRARATRELLERFAQDRWGSDAELRDAEIAVLKELQTSSGMQAMGEWFHAHGLLKDIPAANFSSPFSTLMIFTPGDEVLNACHCLMKASASRGQRIKGFHSSWYRIGYSEYNNYLQHQLDSKASSLKLIQLISSL